MRTPASAGLVALPDLMGGQVLAGAHRRADDDERAPPSASAVVCRPSAEVGSSSNSTCGSSAIVLYEA
jgi:hypothetical protein